MLDQIAVTRLAPGIAVIHLPAEVDVYTVPAIRQLHVKLVADGVYMQIFDLADVKMIDFTGLGVLVGAKRRLAAHAGTIVLDSPSPTVAHILNVVTGVGKFFHIVETVYSGSEA